AVPRSDERILKAGHRPDGLPVIGPVPGFENAFIAAGHSTAGLPLAPGTAKMIADYVTGRPPAGPDPLDPARRAARRRPGRRAGRPRGRILLTRPAGPEGGAPAAGRNGGMTT